MKKPWWDKGTRSKHLPPERPQRVVGMKQWHVLRDRRFDWDGGAVMVNYYEVAYGRIETITSKVIASYQTEAEAVAMRKLLTATDTEKVRLDRW